MSGSESGTKADDETETEAQDAAERRARAALALAEELDARSPKFDPLKALYCPQARVPVPAPSAPLYNNLKQYEASRAFGSAVLTAGGDSAAEAERRATASRLAREECERDLREKNERRFTKAQALTTVERKYVSKNLLTRCQRVVGPLAALKDCMEKRIRVKVVTRHATGVRGQLIGYLEAFDKQWNMAVSDVLEIWRRKSKTKRKVPPLLGEPCPPGSAARLAPSPTVNETSVGKGLVECTRHIPQVLVRGEHVVLVQIIERRS